MLSMLNAGRKVEDAFIRFAHMDTCQRKYDLIVRPTYIGHSCGGRSPPVPYESAPSPTQVTLEATPNNIFR